MREWGVQFKEYDGRWGDVRFTDPWGLGRPLRREDCERWIETTVGSVTGRNARLVSREVSDWYSIEADMIGVYALDLPVRVQNALHRAGYQTLGEIREGFDSGRVQIIRNLGPKGVAAVQAVLLEDGLYE